MTDDFAQTFGFRELWAKGRKLFLNGTEIHLRPTCSSYLEGVAGDSQLNIENVIKGSLYAGWNMETHGPCDPGPARVRGLQASRH